VELVSLERWRDEILTSEQYSATAQPQNVVQGLRKRLEAAVAAEAFEEAARLRDEIRRLHEGRTKKEE
jgi:protein-arginine kinase activator protein McsA